MTVSKGLIILIALLYLSSCDTDMNVPWVASNKINLNSKFVVNGANNSIRESTINSYFYDKKNAATDVDSVLIDKIKLNRISKGEYKAENNFVFDRDINLLVYNFLGLNIDTLVQQIDSIRFDGINNGDTISKSDLTTVKYNHIEENHYIFEIGNELEYEDQDYLAESFNIDGNDYGFIKLTPEILYNFPSNNSYYLAIEGTKSAVYIFENTSSYILEFDSKYVYYIKFYLTD